MSDEDFNKLHKAKIAFMERICEKFPGATFFGNEIIAGGRVRGSIQLKTDDTHAWFEAVLKEEQSK